MKTPIPYSPLSGGVMFEPRADRRRASDRRNTDRRTDDVTDMDPAVIALACDLAELRKSVNALAGQVDRSRAVAELARELAGRKTLDAVAEATVDALTERMGYRHVTMWVKPVDANAPRFLRSSGVESTEPDRFCALRVGGQPVGWLAVGAVDPAKRAVAGVLDEVLPLVAGAIEGARAHESLRARVVRLEEKVEDREWDAAIAKARLADAQAAKGYTVEPPSEHSAPIDLLSLRRPPVQSFAAAARPAASPRNPAGSLFTALEDGWFHDGDDATEAEDFYADISTPPAEDLYC